jgi:lysophospholipase L1-like esterase
MHPSTDESPENMNEAKLPRRDWILLPLLGLLTICTLAGSLELIASRVYTESRPFIPACMEPPGPEGRARAIPNHVCWDKKFESQWVEYRFNGCGHRAGMECAPKAPGTYRIVLIGSSIAMGNLVPREKTFAALLPVELTQLTGRKIDLYNESMVATTPQVVAQRMNEVLAAKPDLILLALTPSDIALETPHTGPPNAPIESGSFLSNARLRIRTTLASESFLNAAHDLWERGTEKFGETASGALLLHVLNQSRSQYVKSSLSGRDAEFMRVPTGADWEDYLRQFDADSAEIVRQAKDADVPLVVTLVPAPAQAALISLGEWPKGFDPYKLNDHLRATITNQGEIYSDILPDYRGIANPERAYFLLDGHPNPEGHAIIARSLAKELTGGAIPALKAIPSQQTVLERNR